VVKKYKQNYCSENNRLLKDADLREIRFFVLLTMFM